LAAYVFRQWQQNCINKVDFDFNPINSTVMILQRDAFPLTVQAFELNDNKEFFIAEQVVNSQQEVDAFSSRYAGKVIKVKPVSTSTDTSTTKYTRKSSPWTAIFIILIILIILIAIGFYTGWIQRTTGITL
jgi:hypothetical protein